MFVMASPSHRFWKRELKKSVKIGRICSNLARARHAGQVDVAGLRVENSTSNGDVPTDE